MLGVTLLWTGIPSRGGVEILLVTSCDRNRDKLWPDGPHGLYSDLTTTDSSLAPGETKYIILYPEYTYNANTWD